MTSVATPPIAFDRGYWVADNDGTQSRSAMARASGPYSSAVPSRISDLEFTLPSDVMSTVVQATAALAALSSHARSTFGPSAPLLGPMSAILLRTEASSSSQIEHLTVGARQLALAILDESRSVNAQLVVKNVRAMEKAIAAGADISEETLLIIHREILRDHPHLSAHAGQYRRELVWVGGTNVSPQQASFVAPQADLVPHLMQDLVAFMRRTDLPPLVQAALAHAQFETIHPFVDGNGRVGRALVHTLLRSADPTQGTVAPISAGLLKDPDAYIRALGRYRHGDGGPIIEQFAHAALFAAQSGKELTDRLGAQVKRGKEALSGLRSDSTAWKILPVLVSNPVVTSSFLQKELGGSPRAVLAALDQLERREVLVERTGKRRNRVWQHGPILAILDDYASQLRRP